MEDDSVYRAEFLVSSLEEALKHARRIHESELSAFANRGNYDKWCKSIDAISASEKHLYDAMRQAMDCVVNMIL